MVQTHVSWIFLTDTHAYKIKKPVDFGFLNFSTIDRRRFYCNEEVRCNSRLCPDIYLGVVEVREMGDGAAFWGNGPLLDYAVKMVRLPAEKMLDRLVQGNEISAEDIQDVANIIVDFHRDAATSPHISEYGKLDRILFNWQENFDQTATFEDLLPADERETIRAWVTSFARENSRLFQDRVSNGFIRECDGDIHLENICLYDRKVCIFDCIEFNERFRCCDTAADLAFLLMDLDFHKRHDLAEIACEAYLNRSGDSAMKPLLDFYKVYRAFVRGKVEGLRAHDSSIERTEQVESMAKARKYFRLSRGYIERHRLPPTLFILCGLMGTGKTTLASQLSFELGTAVFSSDEERKRMAGISEQAANVVDYGTGLYDEQATEATYHRLVERAEAELAKGCSVVLDASFIRFEHRKWCADAAKRHGVAFVIIHVICSETENMNRLRKRLLSGPSVSDGREELLPAQRRHLQVPGPEEGRLIALEAENAPEVLANRIYAGLFSC